MRRVHNKSSFGYFLPFLILVGVGVVGVLGFQLWSSLQGAKGDVFFYIAEGKVKILPYGQAEWESGYSGTKLLVGDSLKTSVDGRAVLEFFNGTKVRLGEDTQITLLDVSKRSDSEKIIIALDHGKAWFNKMKSEEVQSSLLEVHTVHMLVKDTGTVFEVQRDSVESVRVMKGSVNLNILVDGDNSGQTTVSQDVSIGQEVDVDEALLKALRNHENPSLVLKIRSDFETSDWYQWNSREDTSPTDFSRGGSKITPSGVSNDRTQEGTSSFSSQQIKSSSQLSVGVASQQDFVTSDGSPTILQPSGGTTTITVGKTTISGNVPAGTKQVLVKQMLDGKLDEYTLGKFKSGDTTFAYNISEQLGNLLSGENTYSFYAVDSNGKQSQPAQVVITYDKSAKTVLNESLTSPIVKTFNGAISSTLTVSPVRVEGEIHGAEKVVVNGYTLTKFVPGATVWAYFADESRGNLKPGVNNFEVYGLDSDGKESSRVKFTITYNKPAVSQTQQVSNPVVAPVNSSIPSVPDGIL